MRNTGFSILLFACLTIFCAQALHAADAAQRLQQAQQALTGEHKDIATASKILRDLAQSGTAGKDPETSVWTYIYLGYIEDRADNRDAAIAWYQKALAVEGAHSSSADVARYGLRKPLVWIRHLDAPSPHSATKGAPNPPQNPHKPVAPDRNSKAYVTKIPPEGLTLAKDLSAKERRENFQALWSIIHDYYAHFDLKSIDWSNIGKRYDARLDTLTGDSDFYLMMFQLVNELKDTHSWLANYSAPALALAVPDLQLDSFQGKPYVISGPKAGWELLSVDGIAVTEKLESLRPSITARSSERAFRRHAVPFLLAGKKGESTTVVLRAPDGSSETLTLPRDLRPDLHSPARRVAINLNTQKFVHFGRYPSGLGYIHIASFAGREEIEREFDRALDSLRDTSGLILDIRDNPGGFGHPDVVGRFLRKRTLVGISYVKNGPKRTDFEKVNIYDDRTGKWQYTRPVALLVNDLTGSAADLFATELRNAANVVTVGATTHGNLSGVAIHAVLPSGLVVRISNGYIADAKNRPIEMNGNVPDIIVDPDIQDYLNARDPVLDRATDILLKRAAK